MNIYIKIELLHREIEGRLLLALVAAERGHRVLLGDLGDLLSHRRWLPPGVFHDKSLTPSVGKLAHHRGLVGAGFHVTSQDEEHGLLADDYRVFLAKRYSEESVGMAAGVMAWGPFDREALVSAHPAAADRIRMTGSPRVDVWRPDVATVHDGADRPGVGDAPYVLFCTSNLGRVPFWVVLRDTRPTYHRTGPDPAAEMARGTAAQLLHAAAIIEAVGALREARPDLMVVVRPHPSEDDDAWRDLLAPVPGVVVTRHGGLGRWIRGATAVVHNGSTSGLEAAVGGVPGIAYLPTGLRADALVNRLSRPANDVSDLIAAVDDAGDQGRRATWYAGPAREVLQSRFAALDGRLAADRIVDVWESLDAAGRGRAFAPRARTVTGRAHAVAGGMRMRLRGDHAPSPFRLGAKFPADGFDEVDALHRRFTAALDRFERVHVRRVGRRLVALEA